MTLVGVSYYSFRKPKYRKDHTRTSAVSHPHVRFLGECCEHTSFLRCRRTQQKKQGMERVWRRFWSSPFRSKKYLTGEKTSEHRIFEGLTFLSSFPTDEGTHTRVKPCVMDIGKPLISHTSLWAEKWIHDRHMDVQIRESLLSSLSKWNHKRGDTGAHQCLSFKVGLCTLDFCCFCKGALKCDIWGNILQALVLVINR